MSNEDFGKKLIRIRKAKGLTQEELADLCSITTRTIQRIESGAVQPRTYTVKAISEALGVDFFESFDQNSELKSPKNLGRFKDLFNLKVNTVKKISILTAPFVIGFLFYSYVFNLEVKPSTSNKEASAEVPINEEELLANDYKIVTNFGEIGKDWAIVMKDNKYGCIDTNYKIVVPIKYEIIGKFGEIGKDWAILMKDKKYGFVDGKAKLIVPVEYEFVGRFGEIGKDWAIVMKNGKYGFINAKGKTVVPVEYDFVGRFGEIGKDWAIVMKNNKYGFLDARGKIKVPVVYDFVGRYGEIGIDWAIVMKNSKYGFLDANGEVIVKMEYDFIGRFGEIGIDCAIVMKNNKYGLLNKKGKVTLSCEYENIQVQGTYLLLSKNGKNKRVKIEGLR